MLSIYKEKLDGIKNEIYGIGLQVVRANEIALQALKNQDYEKFSEAKNELSNLEKTSNKIDNMIVSTLALHAPEAKDLRQMVAYLKITNEIVRAATNTKSFIKTFAKIIACELDVDKINEYGIPLHKSAILAITTALEIIKTKDEDEIEDEFHKVIVEESKTDDLYSMIEKNILKMITKNKELSKDYFDVLSSYRRLEKLADRAASIANLLLFAHLGGEIHQA
jgi:phosphate transport system protein